MGETTLYDKIINVTITNTAGDTFQILTPPIGSYLAGTLHGRKPAMTFSGTFVSGSSMLNATLTVVNLNTLIPIDSFYGTTGTTKTSKAVIEMGYSNNVVTCVEGEITNAYRASPSPDGETVFTVMLGAYSDWLNKTVSLVWEPNKDVLSIIEQLATLVGLTVKTEIESNTMLTSVYVHGTGTVKDVLHKIAKMYGLVIRPENKSLIVIKNKGNTGTVHRLNYISDISITAAGCNVTAPYVPGVMPDDVIEVNSKYFKADYSSTISERYVTFRVISMDVQFGTVSDENAMSIVATYVSTS